LCHLNPFEFFYHKGCDESFLRYINVPTLSLYLAKSSI